MDAPPICKQQQSHSSQYHLNRLVADYDTFMRYRKVASWVLAQQDMLQHAVTHSLLLKANGADVGKHIGVLSL